MKKFLSVVLSLTIVFISSVGFNFTAYAAGTSVSDAEMISLNIEYSGNLQSGTFGKQFDFYYFEMPKNGEITVKADKYDGKYNLFFAIYDVSGENIYEREGTYNQAYDSSRVYETITLKKGLYYVSLANYSLSGYSYNEGGTYCFSINYKPTVNKTLNLKVKAKKGRKIYVQWSKVSDVDGYQLYYSRYKNFNKSVAKKIISGDVNLYSGKNLKKGKTYYFRVRAYKNYNGKKIYGKWSDVKSVKVK